MKPVKVSMDSLMISLSRSWRSRYFRICAEVMAKMMSAISYTASPAREIQNMGTLVSSRWKL